MDKRLPPLPIRIKMPLYPVKSSIIPYRKRNNAEYRIRKLFSDWLGCTDNELLLTESASTGLYMYLLSLKKRGLKVALPAYSCQDLVEAIIQSGHEPVFYDIGKDASITRLSVDFAIMKKCEVFIWPSLFGNRNRPKRLINLLIKRGIKVIADEAQSSLFIQQSSYQDFSAVIFSFGPTKWIASIGGGLIYIPGGSNEVKLINQTLLKPCSDNGRLYIYNLAFTEKLYNLAPAVFLRLRIRPKLFSKLDELLESREPRRVEGRTISRQQAYAFIYSLKKYKLKSNDFISSFGVMRNSIEASIGKNSLEIINDIVGPPTILAVMVAPSDRYKLLSRFSRLGIQSTWYYYPLPFIERYAGYDCQQLLGTLDLCQRIVIIPFQWRHNKKQRKQLIKIINNLDENTKNEDI